MWLTGDRALVTRKNVFFPFASKVVQTSTINDKFPLFKPVEECDGNQKY